MVAGHSWDPLGVLLGALGTFPGPPDRYDKSTCGLIDLYGDSGLSGGALRSVLGASWEPFRQLLRFFGASWELLGRLLGSFCGSSTCSTSKLLYHITCFKEVRISRAGARKSSTRRPAGCLLSASWGLLGISWRLLGSSWSVLEASWRRLGSHVGPLEALKAKMLIFHWFYNGLAAQLLRHGRQQPGGPEPWRG